MGILSRSSLFKEVKFASHHDMRSDTRLATSQQPHAPAWRAPLSEPKQSQSIAIAGLSLKNLTEWAAKRAMTQLDITI